MTISKNSLDLVHFEEMLDSYMPYYQPIVDLTTLQSVKFESLARFKDIQCLDSSGIFDCMHTTNAVLYFSLASAMRDKAYSTVSINLNSQSVNSKFFKTLDEIDINIRAKIEFEILEKDLRATAELVYKLKQIKSMGFLISLDDFGQGGSNVEILEKVEFDAIKIDISVVLSKRTIDDEIVKLKHLVCFLHCYSPNIIAERIETHEQLSVCIDLGIRYGQGYLLGKPRPINTTECNKINIADMKE
jgi:EAL domain-containing protein (putative c-di-GMP-specific phosphodiesterase class I)